MPDTPEQENAKRLDRALGIDSAEEEGWRVVSKKKPMNDPEVHKPKGDTRSMKEILTGVAAKAALDAIMKPPVVEMPDDGSEPEEDEEPEEKESEELEEVKEPEEVEETPSSEEAPEEQEPEPKKVRRPGRGLGRINQKKQDPKPVTEVRSPEPKKALKTFKPKKQKVRESQRTNSKKTTPLTPKDLALVVDRMPMTKRWIRNRALLLLGFSSGLRRSELVSVRLEGMRFTDEGLVVAIHGAGGVEQFFIPRIKGRLCTVGAIARWIMSSGIREGYLFRLIYDSGVIDRNHDKHLSSRYVGKVVKKAAKIAELDSRLYTGRSLRAGYAETVRAAAERAVNDVDSVRRYMRPQVVQDRS